MPPWPIASLAPPANAKNIQRNTMPVDGGHCWVVVFECGSSWEQMVSQVESSASALGFSNYLEDYEKITKKKSRNRDISLMSCRQFYCTKRQLVFTVENFNLGKDVKPKDGWRYIFRIEPFTEFERDLFMNP